MTRPLPELDRLEERFLYQDEGLVVVDKPACTSLADKQRLLGTAPNVPGTVWAYNNWDYNALTTIFEQSTGLRVAQAFLKGIAHPLAMQDYRPAAVFYPQGTANSGTVTLTDGSDSKRVIFSWTGRIRISGPAS